MDRNIARIVTLIVIGSACAACNREAKPEPPKSPDELIQILRKADLDVQKAGAFNNEPPAELNMKLKVNGVDDFVATRYPTERQAKEYCETQNACVPLAYWTIEALPTAARTPTWEKITAALGAKAARPDASTHTP